MADAQLFKGALIPIILKLLQSQDKMYGYEITRKVKEITSGKMNITEGALYPALHKLEGEGLLRVTLVMESNRQRKYYSLTPNGKKSLRYKLEDMQAFLEQMKQIFNPAINLAG